LDNCIQAGLSSTCGTRYFQQGGQAMITRSDTTAASGTFIGQASDLILSEWDTANDAPVPNGKCYQVGNASWNASWPFLP
jgi:hypothetical protein